MTNEKAISRAAVGYARQLKNLSISYSLVTAPAVVSSFVSLNTFPQNLCTPVILSSVSSNVM